MHQIRNVPEPTLLNLGGYARAPRYGLNDAQVGQHGQFSQQRRRSSTLDCRLIHCIQLIPIGSRENCL